MHLMVYAPYGRTGITMLQELCRRLGIGSDAADDELRDLLLTLQALPPGHPLAALLRTAPDLRDEAALADALLHPQERAYTVPELFTFLVRSDVRLRSLAEASPVQPALRPHRRTRHTARIAKLPPAEQGAAVELLRGTMLRHSVIAHADAGTAAAHRLDFAGERWQRYVPIRVPDTVVVEERLPPGAAAVLINRTHSCPDIHLVVDAGKRPFTPPSTACVQPARSRELWGGSAARRRSSSVCTSTIRSSSTLPADGGSGGAPAAGQEHRCVACQECQRNVPAVAHPHTDGADVRHGLGHGDAGRRPEPNHRAAKADGVGQKGPVVARPGPAPAW